MSGEDGKQGFKVADRRRFDSAGNARSDSDITDTTTVKAPSVEKQASQAAPAAGPQAQNDSKHAKTEEAGEIDFSSFVMSLATQALMQLGQLPPPAGMEVQVDKIAAKQAIDIISMLDVKTKGNLDAGEQRLIEEVLHSLRMSYVRTA